jgi:hypothetical protein
MQAQREVEGRERGRHRIDRRLDHVARELEHVRTLEEAKQRALDVAADVDREEL